MKTLKNTPENTLDIQYPAPVRRWKLYRQWQDVLLLHYQADQNSLLQLLPKGITVDTFEGMAWVSLLAFSVRKLRYRFLPNIPCISRSNEVQLRTYVIRDGIPGIYILSLQADSLAAVLLPRWLMGLPYQQSEMNSQSGYFSSDSCKDTRRLKAIFYPGSAIETKDALDLWLTGHQAMYISKGSRLCRYEIKQQSCKLREAAITGVTENYTFGLAAKEGPSRQHYIKNIKVFTWSPTRL